MNLVANRRESHDNYQQLSILCAYCIEGKFGYKEMYIKMGLKEERGIEMIAPGYHIKSEIFKCK